VAQRKQLIRLALFGQPISASLSPSIHRLFAAQFGLHIEFQRIETGPGGFPQALAAFRSDGGVGCNVTLPLKRDAWQLAAVSAAEVRQAQAANTLVYQPSVGWHAYNTDGAGLLADLQVNHGIRLDGKRLLIMGAGGAVAGILAPLQAAGPAEITLVNRNLERAQSLASRSRGGASVAVAAWENLPQLGSFDLVINATSLGHRGVAPALPAALFAAGAICYDLNYYTASQPLKACCEALGQPYIDGLGMLVEQAAKSFRLWTGKQPASASVLQAMRATH